MASKLKKGSKTSKDKHVSPKGKIIIKATFNNTIITVTDMQGNTLAWASGGSMQFKGSRKSTPYAAQLATKKVMNTARSMGLHEVDVYVKGPGTGRESAVRAVASSGIKIKLIKDATSIPHNGCRPRKKRRV